MASKPATESRNKRAKQVTNGQNAFRDSMLETAYRRLQAWMPNEVFDTPQKICERDNLTQAEALPKSSDLHYKMFSVEN